MRLFIRIFFFVVVAFTLVSDTQKHIQHEKQSATPQATQRPDCAKERQTTGRQTQTQYRPALEPGLAVD